MLIAAIIIYVICALLFGVLWPITMFFRGGCLGQIICLAWFALLVFGINKSTDEAEPESEKSTIEAETELEQKSLDRDSLACICGELFGVEAYKNLPENTLNKSYLLQVIDTLKHKHVVPGFFAGMYIANENLNFCKDFNQKYQYDLPKAEMDNLAVYYVQVGEDSSLNYNQYKQAMENLSGNGNRILSHSVHIYHTFTKFLAYNANLYLGSDSSGKILGMKQGLELFNSFFSDEDRKRGYHKFMAANYIVELNMIASCAFSDYYYMDMCRGFERAMKQGYVDNYSEKQKILDDFLEGKPMRPQMDFIIP